MIIGNAPSCRKEEEISCENCNAACCRYIELDVKGLTNDRRKWLAFHNIFYDDVSQKLIIPLKCLYLKNNKCLIYDKRPNVCRKFKVGSDLCIRARRIVKIL